jgi:hypothetical protein
VTLRKVAAQLRLECAVSCHLGKKRARQQAERTREYFCWKMEPRPARGLGSGHRKPERVLQFRAGGTNLKR